MLSFWYGCELLSVIISTGLRDKPHIVVVAAVTSVVATGIAMLKEILTRTRFAACKMSGVRLVRRKVRFVSFTLRNRSRTIFSLPAIFALCHFTHSVKQMAFQGFRERSVSWRISCRFPEVTQSPPKETAMKKIQNVLTIALPAALMIAVFCNVGQTVTAQNPNPSSIVSAQQQPTQQQDEQKPAPETKTFTGKIVKSGDALVLSDAESKMMYKLDDQQKAKEFVNKDVKVVGVLDDSTGMIRVSSIEPA